MAKEHHRGLWGEIVGPPFASSIFCFLSPFDLKKKENLMWGEISFFSSFMMG
jgi:hypothetical protein